MKRIKHKMKTASLLVAGALAASSCQDWLTVYPQNKITEEQFWEDKNDLDGVRYAAYQQMASTLEKIVLWGDLRSDTYTLNTADTKTDVQDLYREIREGHIDRDSTSTYFDWSGFYTTINYCNKVLQHGPEVLARDKQFTSAEWQQMRAEMVTLRALNYFYLLRAFKDIPYSTKVVNKDTEVEAFGATNQLVVLDSLIADVERVKGQARNRFSSTKDTKGMITNPAIYALLSDMYLWRASLHEGRGITRDTVHIRNVATKDSSYVVHTVAGDYQKCIDYADLALAALVRQNENNRNSYGSRRLEMASYGLTDVNLYKNDFENFIGGNTPRLYAALSIFNGGNSEESIFELQYNASDSRKNGVVTSQWGYSDAIHLAVSDASLGRIYTSTERFRDSRNWICAWSRVNKIGGTAYSSTLPGLYCFKWHVVSPEMPLTATPTCEQLSLEVSSGNDYRNWIVYRISDVMLQKAEALACLGQGTEAMKYVNAIHRRWYCNDNQSITSQPLEDVNNKEGESFRKTTTAVLDAATLGNLPEPQVTVAAQKYEVAVLNERQLEFIGEGKRWFDLVRYAERHAGGQDGTKDPREWTAAKPIGNGAAGVRQMVDQFLKSEFSSGYTALKNRMKNRYGLYNIIYYMEIKGSNGKLEQNPVWNKSTYEK